MKDEIDINGCKKFREVKAVIDDWIEYYNNERYQWQLAKLSPNEYYQYIMTGVYPFRRYNKIAKRTERMNGCSLLNNFENVLDKGYSLHRYGNL